MAYKYKPNKGMKKRFRVSATGKLKHNHMFTSHLRSSRTSKRKRHLRHAEVLFEGHARNMRGYMGVSALRPREIAHERRLAEAEKAAPQSEKTEPRAEKKAPRTQKKEKSANK